MLLAFLIGIACTSCVGPSYAALQRKGRLMQPAPNKGLVIVYWAKAPFNDGTLGMDFRVYANDQLAVRHIRSDQFTAWQADPGEYTIGTRARTTPSTIIGSLYFSSYNLSPMRALMNGRQTHLVIKVKPGEVNYVEMAWPWTKHEILMLEMRPEVGRQRIQNCNWVDP